jgi:inositol-pentakisphosphate 2-kinase
MIEEEIEKDRADYKEIEKELAEGRSLLSATCENDSPKIVDKIVAPIWDVGYSLSYLAEGGANVIFKIELRGAAYFHLLPAPTQRKMQALQGMLLRVRKEVGTHTRSTSEMVDEYEQRIKPLFPSKYLPRQTLIRLPKNITIHLRKLLAGAEEQGKRPSKRRGEQIVGQTIVSTAGLASSNHRNTEDYGILIQDLSPKVLTEYLLEFKPKWLIPSPSTPSGSTRCRTCALREMRRADGTPPGRGDSQFCPRDLLSGKTYVLRPALRKLWTIDKLDDEDLDDPKYGVPMAKKTVNSQGRGDMFEREFRSKVHRLLGRLKIFQEMHYHAGMRDFDTGGDRELSVAMALRDCSVFLRVEATISKIKILDVKLADLDLKLTSRANREKWIGTERRLIEEGWYQGKMPPGVVEDKVTCWFSRSCSSRDDHPRDV